MTSPYDDPALYDALFEQFDFDCAYYLALARRSGGPVLDVGCGTGRVLLRLAAQGCEVDGWDPSTSMITHLRRKAVALGLSPRLFCGGVEAMPSSPRYGLVLCAFNAFAHNLTTDAQIDLLCRMRASLRDGGRIAIGAGHPSFAEWATPPGEPVLEFETDRPAHGSKLRLFDQRTFDPVAQTQHSRIAVHEVAADGALIARHDSETTVRWTFQCEFELLLRAAGFMRWRISGGYADESRTSDAQPLVVEAWWKPARAASTWPRR